MKVKKVKLLLKNSIPAWKSKHKHTDTYATEKKGSKCNNHHKKLIVYYYKHFKLFSKIGGFISFQKQFFKAKTYKSPMYYIVL